MKKWIYMLLVVLGLFGTVLAYKAYSINKMINKMANAPEPSFPVTSYQIKPQPWDSSLNVIGFIEPHQGIELTTQVNGIVDKIYFKSGQIVEKGDLIIQLDSKVEIANLAAIKAQIPAAKAQYKRYLSLYKTKSISKEALDTAKASYKSLLAQNDSLQAIIERMTIKAPFSGKLGLREVDLGQFITAGTKITQLEDNSQVRLRFSVAQQELAKLKIGQQVAVKVESYVDKTFIGKISAIEPLVNVKSGLVQAQAELDNSQKLLYSGMYAQAQIHLMKKEQQIVIPQTAITFNLYGSNVFVLQKDEKDVLRSYQRTVTPGEQKLDSVQIDKGLQAGDIIVTTGQVRLSNGSKVKIIEENLHKPLKEIPAL